MQPILIAHGPAFKKNFSMESISSVDLYPLLCHLLGIDPLPNNGTFKNIQKLLVSVRVITAGISIMDIESQNGLNMYAWPGILLGSILVVGFLIVFVQKMTKSQMSGLNVYQGEMAQPLLLS